MFEYKVLGALWPDEDEIIVALVDGENPIKTFKEIPPLHSALNKYAREGWEVISSYGSGKNAKGVIILRKKKV